ncbi:MAG: TauD/TfdA family dioxygenase [Cyanobacteria bacterium P01_G01_bin.54]
MITQKSTGLQGLRLSCTHKTTLHSPDQESELKQYLADYGYVYLPNQPENFDWIGCTQDLTQAKLMRQDNGDSIHDVKCKAGFELLSDSQSKNPLRYHTEAPYFPTPPHYIALWCVKPDIVDGHTILSDSRDFLRSWLTQEEQQQLAKKKYRYTDLSGKYLSYYSILQFPRCGEYILRFSLNNLLYGHPSPDINAEPINQDPFLNDICQRIVEFCADEHKAIRLRRNSLLIVDNWIMLHSRTAFADPNRHLQRIWLA